MILGNDRALSLSISKEIESLVNGQLKLDVSKRFRHDFGFTNEKRAESTSQRGNEVLMKIWQEVSNRPALLPPQEKRNMYSNTLWRNLSDEFRKFNLNERIDYVFEPLNGRLESQGNAKKIRLVPPEIKVKGDLTVEMMTPNIGKAAKLKEAHSEIIANLYPVRIPNYSRLGPTCGFSQYLNESRLLNKNTQNEKRFLIRKAEEFEKESKRHKWLSDVRNPPIDKNGFILPHENYKRYEHCFNASRNREAYEEFVRQSLIKESCQNTKIPYETDIFGRLVQRNPQYPRIWKLTTANEKEEKSLFNTY